MQRKVFSAEFKAKVALEALAGRQTVNEIAGTYEVHPHQVASWKREAQDGLKALFERLESVLGLAFPSGHLMRMHLVSPRDLVDRLAAGQRFQRHFRLELRTEYFPLHRSSPRRHAILPVQSTTLFTCPKSGDHYIHSMAISRSR